MKDCWIAGLLKLLHVSRQQSNNSAIPTIQQFSNSTIKNNEKANPFSPTQLFGWGSGGAE
jgi:hypothetical protein